MKAFSVRWRSARQFREWELFANETVGACLWAALNESGGLQIWQSGTIWKCPGCADRTLKTEEFVEGLRRAELHLQAMESGRRLVGESGQAGAEKALAWIADVSAKMFGCERDRVYLKDESGYCRYSEETYLSRI